MSVDLFNLQVKLYAKLTPSDSQINKIEEEIFLRKDVVNTEVLPKAAGNILRNVLMQENSVVIDPKLYCKWRKSSTEGENFMKSLLSKFMSEALNVSQVASCHWAGLFIIHVIFGAESKNHILFISSLVFVNFLKEKLCFIILKEKHNLNCAEVRLVQLSV